MTSNFLFLIAIVAAFAAIPYAIFHFVVSATEFEMAEAGASGALTPAPWYQASFRAAVFFLIVGPTIGCVVLFLVLFLVIAFNFPLQPASPTNWISMVYSLPFAYLFGAMPALIAGAMYGAIQAKIFTNRSPSWPMRLMAGAVVGLVAGWLFFDGHENVFTPLAIVSGAITALSVSGGLYRRLFTRATPGLASPRVFPTPWNDYREP